MSAWFLGRTQTILGAEFLQSLGLFMIQPPLQALHMQCFLSQVKNFETRQSLESASDFLYLSIPKAVACYNKQ